MKINVFTWVDFMMVPIWLTIIFTSATIIRRSRYSNDSTGDFFIPALTLKLLGGLLLGLTYQYYYSSGDTITYYLTAKGIFLVFLDNFKDGWALLTADFSIPGDESRIIAAKYKNMGILLPYFGDPAAYNVSRIVFFANLLTYNSYYAGTLLLSTFSFMGMWGLFRTFYRQYPEITVRLAIAVFFIPSVFFWGSGTLKDPITLGTLGLLTYSSYMILYGKIKSLLAIPLCIISAIIIYIIKPYILMSFLPFVAIWLGTIVRARIKNGPFRIVFTPIIFTFVLGVGYYALTILETGKYSLERVLSTAVITKSDLVRGYYYSDAKGSSYNVGEFDATITSQIALAPTALVTTFFRPFLWEARNPLMFFAALESTIMTFFFLFIVFRTGIINILIVMYRRPFVFFSFGYSLSFGYMVGLTSGNFGNLVRYKIPCIPFFVAALFIVEYLVSKNRKERFTEFETKGKK